MRLGYQRSELHGDGDREFHAHGVGASAYGYQVPSTDTVSDPLFPQWLCNVNLPSGLVTMGCASSSSLPAPPTNINVTVQ